MKTTLCRFDSDRSRSCLTLIVVLAFLLVWSSRSYLQAQDDPGTNNLVNPALDWIPPQPDSTQAEPTPIPGAVDDTSIANPDSTPGVPDANGSGTPAPTPVPGGNDRNASAGATPSPTPPDTTAPATDPDSSTDADPPVLDPNTAPNNNPTNQTFQISETDNFTNSTDPDPAATEAAIAQTFGQMDPATVAAVSPTATEVTPTTNSDVSTIIATGCGYDAWTGSSRRTVTDIHPVAGSVGNELKFVRTYSSHFNQWAYSYNWHLFGRPARKLSCLTPDGRTLTFKAPDPTNMPHEIAYRAGGGTKERLILQNDDGISGQNSLHGWGHLYLEDGSEVSFERITWHMTGDDGVQPYFIDNYVARSVTNPHGQVTKLTFLPDVPTTPPTGSMVSPRLYLVKDSSSRTLTYTYVPNTQLLYQVIASDNQKVTFSYTPIIDTQNHITLSLLTGATYCDGSTAAYTYTMAYNVDIRTGVRGGGLYLFTAQDSHAEGAMTSIRYEYKLDADSRYAGEITAEQHLDGTTIVDVSRFNSARGSGPSTPVETRGDGPSRSFEIERVGDDETPLVNWKTDFKGVKEAFEYDVNHFLKKFVDRKGNTTLYDTEPILGMPRTVTFQDPSNPNDPNPANIKYTYSNAATPYHVHTVTDENGNLTTYDRDDFNQITGIHYPDGAFEGFSYDNLGNVIRHQRKAYGASTPVVYDHAQYTNNLLTTLWNPTTNATVPTSGAKTTFTYYPSNNVWAYRLQTVTDQRGYTTTYEYDLDFTTGVRCPGRGLVTKITHYDGFHQTFGYDVFGNKSWEENEVRDASGAGQRTSYIYDDYNRLLTKTLPGLPVSTTTYDYLRPGKSAYSHTTNSWRVKSDGPSPKVSTLNNYDANLRVSWSTQGYASSPSVDATTYFDYDANGNQTKITDPRGALLGDADHTTIIDYDYRNRKKSLTEPPAQSGFAPRVTQWAYYPNGDLQTITRPDTHSESYTYDGMHRILTHTEPKDSTTNLTTTFVYNDSGTLRTVRDANLHTTTFTYDSLDRKIRMDYPGNNLYQSWVYDAASNMTVRQTVDPTVIETFTYDTRNRKWSMRLGKRQGTTNRVDPAQTYYDGDYTYDPASRLLTAINRISNVTRTYDPAGRLLTEAEAFVGVPAGFGEKKLQYVYNDLSKISRIYTLPEHPLGDGYDFTLGYDGMGRETTIKITYDQNPGPYYQYYYDAASNVTQRKNFLNTTRIEYYPDNINRLIHIDRYVHGAVWNVWYGYDSMNREKYATYVEPAGATTDFFDYDLSGEITGARYGTTQSGSNWINPTRTVSYVWDNAGNRTIVTDTNTAVGTKYYTTNDLNQYSHVGTSTGGNEDVISNGLENHVRTYRGITYGYYGDRYLSSVSGVDNVYQLYYDALGRCVKRTLVSAGNPTTTNYYLFDGEHWIDEYDANGVFVSNAFYGQGIDEIIARGWMHGEYPLPDRNGNISLITNGTYAGAHGDVTESYHYDAFGSPTIRDATNHVISSSAATVKNRFLFTGREYNSQFGFYEYRARAYHPGLGRFMSEDPKGFDAGDYNLFRYCANDPWDLRDPMGLDSEQNPDDSYHFLMRNGFNLNHLQGAYVQSQRTGAHYQCAGAAQFLAGTKDSSGAVHDVPKAATWRQGDAVSERTPNGTLIARGWKDGKYPNEAKVTDKEKAEGNVLNHTGIKVGWNAKTKEVIVLDQNASRDGSLQTHQWNPKEGNWSVVNSERAQSKEASQGIIKPAKNE